MKKLNILALLTSIYLASCSSQSALEAEINDFQQETTPEEWLDMAKQSHKLGNLSEALAAYNETLSREPDNKQAIIGLAKSYTALHQYQKAIKQWSRLLQLSPGDTSAKIAKARLLIRFGEFEESESLLTDSSIQQPDNWRVWDTLGVINDLKGNYEQASRYYLKALTLNGSEPGIYNNLGYSQMMSQSYKEASETLQKGLQLNPNSKHIRSNLAIVQAWQGNYKDALSTSNTLMNEAESYNNVGYIALMRDDFETAEKYFQKAIDMSPTFYRKAFVNLEKLRTKRTEMNQ